MGSAIPQVIAEDRASGAQVIDGSLKFDNTKFQHLTKVFTNNFGDRQSWTWSGWVKQNSLSLSRQVLFGASGGASDTFLLEFGFDTNGLYATVNTSATLSTARFRDPSAWLHYFVKYDGTEIKWFVNGVEAHTWSQYSGDLGINGNWAHDIGKGTATGGRHFDGSMSQVYFIDGQALGPEYFGFTDPLTNTWRPKKLEQFPKRSFTNPRWYSSPNVYTSVADIVANGTDRGNGGVSLTNEYAYLVFNDGGYAHNGGPNNAPDYPVFTDSMVIGDGTALTRGFYYNTSNGWTVAGSFSGNASEWNQWRYSNSSTFASYRISNNFELMNSNARFIVFADNDSHLNPTLATSFDSVTIPTLDTNSFHFQNSEIDTWNTGGNSYYLPLDGNSPIGEDKFNNGNDWTPVNFAGSNIIEKATGALPILNTTNGGNTATAGVRTDAFANNLVLALPLVGIKSDFSNHINSGTTEKAVTITNDAAPSRTQSNFYGGSFIFDATGDNLTIPASSDFNFGSGDYTVEWWMYWTTRTGYQSVIDIGYTAADSFLIQSNTGSSRFIVYAEGVNILEELPAVGDAPLNRWIHYAVVRNGDSMTLYRDGVVSDTGSASSGTATGTAHGSSTHAVDIGNDQYDYGLNGYLQDFRIYKGVAKYTENFIPASTDPDILPDTPSGVSGGSKLAKITDGSVYFDGTDDYLSIPWSSDFDLGTSEFTIELFVNFQDDATTSTVLSWGANESNRFDIGCQSANVLRMFAKSSGTIIVNGSAIISPKKWHHVAVVGYSDVGGGSSAVVLYVDGERKFTNAGALDTYAMPTDTSNSIDIGRRRYDTTNITDYFGGFISNLRIVKGSAVYPYQTNITVPTEPLTNVTNTTLLCCQSTTDVTEGAVKPADVSWVPTGYTYWSGMNENWDVSGTTTSDISATGDGDWIATYLPSSGKYYFETIVNNPGQYRVIGLAIGQSGAGANYLDNMFGYYFNGTGSPPLFLTKNSSGTNRASEAPNSGFSHSNTSELTFHDGDILMWGWDADNDKIYFGLNGTWYNNGDPVAGTGHIVSNEDLSASSFYLKVGYMNSGGHSLNKLSLTNVPSSESGSSSSIVSSREISSYNLVNKASNFNPFNTDINTVRGQETNYCNLNPVSSNNTNITLSEGNLHFEKTSTAGAWGVVYGTIGMTTGKWYWEAEATDVVDENLDFGVTTPDITVAGNGNGNYFDGDFSVKPGYANLSNGDRWAFAIDMDNRTVKMYKNDIEYSTNTIPYTVETLFPCVAGYGAYGTSPAARARVNFGQKPFKLPPPDGYQPINAANVRPETVIARPDQYVGVTTYIGNAPPGSANTQSFNIGFKPDLLWFKVTTATSNNFLVDTVRTRDKVLFSNMNILQSTCDSGKDIVSFDYNGFTVGEGNQTGANEDGEEIVAWAWKAGGDKNTFNVDNVGYSTSTDVNMSVGALNSISYDQSQTWSNLDTYPTSYSPTAPANLFNGVVSTAEADFWYSAGASTVRFDNLVDQLPEIVNTIELYVYDRNGTMIVTVNGVGANNYANTGTYKWIKLTPNKKIVTLTVSGTDSTYWGIGAIKINGVMLANAGVTPANVPSRAPTGCSVGTKQGFSIVTYQGNGSSLSVPHGLTKKPDFFIFKCFSHDQHWAVGHSSDYDKELYLGVDGEYAAGSSANSWGSVPDNNVFTLGSSDYVNTLNRDYICYSWHNVPGLQKFGSYIADNYSVSGGLFIDLGFKPTLFAIKRTDTTGHWWIYDGERNPINLNTGNVIRWNSSGVETAAQTNYAIDFLSNGFKIRNNSNDINVNTGEYIYAAWAESPAFNLYGGQSTAR